MWILRLMGMIAIMMSAFFVTKKIVGLGLGCIAYKNDSVVMTKLAKHKNGDNPLMAEVLAIEEALDLAIKCGWRKVGFF